MAFENVADAGPDGGDDDDDGGCGCRAAGASSNTTPIAELLQIMF